MVPSLSEKLPLLSTRTISSSKQSPLLSGHLPGQPGSPDTSVPPNDFILYEDDPLWVTYPHETYGCLLMFCSSMCFATMQLVVHLSTEYQAFPTASFAVLQGLAVSVFALASILSSSDARAHVMRTPRTDLPFVALRGFLGGAGTNLVIIALNLIPLGTERSLLCLNPIFAICMASAVLGEVFGVFELAAAFMSFVGAALVSNPTLEINLSQFGRSSYLSGCTIAVFAGWLFAAAFVTVKSYAKRVHYLLSVFSVGFWTMLLGIAMGGADPRPLLENPMRTALVLVGCIFGVLSQCFLNKGFEYCRAGMGAVILQADVPISYMLGVIVLAEIPSFVGLFGSSLVTAGALLVTSKNILPRYRP